MAYTLGSLFDGSGGFPLAGCLCGIEPKWAAEVEPYPIAVTRSRFPKMRHLGDISKVNGAEIEPVDIITFGSPCQDLSVAGKRAGLKHEANGDEETTRSGLFMEAVRIIKEMRRATNGEFPKMCLWENVPGAFSSNKGEDFRVVLEELIKIVEPTASMPPVPSNGWAYADSYVLDGGSLAYRVFDAQHWGVPQRRRRIHLVLDLRGERAREVLFERDGVRGYFAQGCTPWQGIAEDAQDRTGADDREGENTGARRLDAIDNTKVYEWHSQDLRLKEINNGVSPTLSAGMGMGGANMTAPMLIQTPTPYTLKIRSGCEGGGKGALVQEDKSATLATNNDQYLFQPAVVLFEPRSQDGTHRLHKDVAPTLNTAQGGQRQPCIAYERHNHPDPTIGLSGGQVSPTLISRMSSAVGTTQDNLIVCEPVVCTNYIVRRLTPTECARLQGFADRWGDIDEKDSFTPEEFNFWLEVRNTHATINGKQVKEYTVKQMLTWYNKLQTDSAEYKMWGNGVALPPALYCMQGIVDALNTEDTDDWMN